MKNNSKIILIIGISLLIFGIIVLFTIIFDPFKSVASSILISIGASLTSVVIIEFIQSKQESYLPDDYYKILTSSIYPRREKQIIDIVLEYDNANKEYPIKVTSVHKFDYYSNIEMCLGTKQVYTDKGSDGKGGFVSVKIGGKEVSNLSSKISDNKKDGKQYFIFPPDTKIFKKSRLQIEFKIINYYRETDRLSWIFQDVSVCKNNELIILVHNCMLDDELSMDDMRVKTSNPKIDIAVAKNSRYKCKKLKCDNCTDCKIKCFKFSEPLVLPFQSFEISWIVKKDD